MMNPLIDPNLWKSRVTHTPMSGTRVELINPKGRVVWVSIVDSVWMRSVEDLEPEPEVIR